MLLEVINDSILTFEAERIGAGQSGYAQLAAISADGFVQMVDRIFSTAILQKICKPQCTAVTNTSSSCVS